MSQPLNLPIQDYQGAKSTLCTGCGHDSVTQAIINAYHRSQVHPFKVAKLSGIGCSSKTPAYFLKQSHGFNTVHGRMAPIATGAKIANSQLKVIGISGDGDTASIGLTGFVHLLRRNLPMVYIIENNGVYGLTKGQFSATSDFESRQKSGELNPFASLDLCALAIESGCEFVARSFSGDAKQLIPLIQAAIEHPGTAVLDILSPCIAYANHEGSTKSYDYVKSHKVALQELGIITEKSETTADYDPGSTVAITLANGSILTLKKLLPDDHDIQDAGHALQLLRESREKGQILTGLFYKNDKKTDLIKTLRLGPKPLTQMTAAELAPHPEAFKKVLAQYR
jgi:2-oxoglutarate ferredoxin oxidoreductase subunit beta